MTGTLSHTIDTIVNTLLEVGERVLEISRDCIVTNQWNSTGEEVGLTDLQNDTITSFFSSHILECFDKRKSITSEHNLIENKFIKKYKIRFLPIHPDKDSIFLVVEFLNIREYGEIKEDNWKHALDAAGDGMWEVFVADQRITFSEKWHSVFGYKSDQIKKISDWMAIIHPDDIQSVQDTRIDYFAGKTRLYNSEFRVKCEDGTYKWVLSRGVIVARDINGNPTLFTGTHTDINKRKLAEEQYFATAQLLSKLINNLQEGILVTDKDRRIIYANQMFCDIYNLDESPEDIAGIDIYKNVASRMPRYVEPNIFYERTMHILDNQEMVLNEEWEMTNGKTLSRDYIPLTLGSDNKGGIWKSRDITHQKNIEQQIAELRNFYEEILNHIGADIVVFDPDQKYLFINPSAIKNPELREWLIGKTDEDYCRVREKALDLVERRRKIFLGARNEKKSIEWEETLINREGITEYHLRNMYPLFDENGKHRFSIGYGLNITDRVKAQQELRTSMDTFASAFNDSGIGMALISPEGDWLDINNVLCKMTGYSKEELQQIPFRHITHPEDLDIDRHLIIRMLKNEITTYSIEKRYISRHVKIVQTLLTLSLVRDNEGMPKFFIAQVVDITAKKEMEWTISKRNTELEATKDNLLNKINQLEDLSHIVAHNLRGPAGNIKMLAEARLSNYQSDKSGGERPKEIFTEEEAMILIHEASKTLMESLGTLMQITEIKLNKEIERDNCDVDTIINDICNQHQSSIFEKHAKLSRHLSVPFIEYPKIYLENIIYNLVSNSLKYTRADVQPEIWIATKTVDGRTQLIVKDNGLGIDLIKYGEKVFRLNEVFHSGFESKGVGLYITKTQVESFGGSIVVKSKPNEGCEFIVTL